MSYRSRVLVQGSLEYSSFTDDNGNQRTSVSVIPGLFRFMHLPNTVLSQIEVVQLTGWQSSFSWGHMRNRING